MCGLSFQDIVLSRYAVKRFDGRKIPESLLHELLDLVRFAPSGLNLQPWKVKVIADERTRELLAPASFDQPQVTTCSHLLVFCANTDLEGQVERVAESMRKAGVPEARVNEYRSFAGSFVRGLTGEGRRIWAQHNVFLALANAVHGAKALGFDSCPMGGFDPSAYSRILKLPGHLIPTMLCAIGYAADTPPPKIRLPMEEILL